MTRVLRSRVTKLEQRRRSTKFTIVWQDSNEPEEITQAKIEAAEKEVGPDGTTVVLDSWRLPAEETAMEIQNVSQR